MCPASSPPLASLQALARAAVHRALRQWPAGRRHLEDLEQEAVLAALEAMRSWEPAQSSWSTWVWWAMRTAIRRFLLRNVGPVTQPDSKRDDATAPRVRGVQIPESLTAASPAPDVRVLALQALGALMRVAHAVLAPYHRRSQSGLALQAFVDRDIEVFVRTALGETVVDTARAVSLSRQATHACLARLRVAVMPLAVASAPAEG